VSRQGVAFDYSSPAELYLSSRKRRHTDYRRFATAAEAIRYAFEELRTRRSRSAWREAEIARNRGRPGRKALYEC
jgi:Arc/MetJ-type ribon-helix-helix transcriptional regulator